MLIADALVVLELLVDRGAEVEVLVLGGIVVVVVLVLVLAACSRISTLEVLDPLNAST